jgi:hypothetical protein
MCAAKIRRVKSFSGRYPWDSAKERRPKGYALVNTQKIDFLAACTVKSPWAKDGALPILASAAVPATGSDFVSLFPGHDRYINLVPSPIRFETQSSYTNLDASK